MKFTVQVKEINYGSIIVDAASPEEALSKAEAGYSMGNTVWDSGEYELSDAKRVPRRDRDAR